MRSCDEGDNPLHDVTVVSQARNTVLQPRPGQATRICGKQLNAIHDAAKAVDTASQ